MLTIVHFKNLYAIFHPLWQVDENIQKIQYDIKT